MNLEQRAVIDLLAKEAHEHAATVDGYPPHDVAVAFVGFVRDLEPAGQAWVEAFVDSLLVIGAKREMTDWRRRNQHAAHTKKGTPVSLPEFAGKQATDAAGNVVNVQARLFDMDLPALRAHRLKLRTTRDTYSKVIRLLSDLIEAMEEDASLVTAGDAFRKLGLAA